MSGRWLIGLALLMLLSVPAAGAEMRGPCEATLEDRGLDGLDADDASQAVALPADRPATFAFSAPQPIERWNATIHYGPFEAPLTLGETRMNATRAQARVPVDGFSWLGSGLYTVSGTVELKDGTTCHGEALIDIEGDVLGTVLGSTAAAITTIGAVGLLAGVRDGYTTALDEAREP